MCLRQAFRVAQQFKHRWIVESEYTLSKDNARVGGTIRSSERYEFHNYKFPRNSCSCSRASKRALKFPSPKPRAPLRSMTSKKTVGRLTIGFEKICSR